jgi:hypothetical protein
MHISYDHTLYELFHGSDQRRRYEAGTTVFSRVEYNTGLLKEPAHVIKYDNIISFYTYHSICISIVAILLYILCLPVLSTDTSTELYAGIFRGFGNRIEKSVFPATPHCCTLRLRQCPDNKTSYEVPRAHNQIISASILLSPSVVRTRNFDIEVSKF